MAQGNIYNFDGLEEFCKENKCGSFKENVLELTAFAGHVLYLFDLNGLSIKLREGSHSSSITLERGSYQEISIREEVNVKLNNVASVDSIICSGSYGY